MSNNIWMQMNSPQLAKIKRFLTESEFRPEYDGFPLRTIQAALNGAEAEIGRLQGVIDILTVELKQLKTELSK